MKYLLPIPVLLSCFLIAGPVAADSQSEISAALGYYAEIWNEGDVETIRGYYHPDFVLITSDGPVPLSQRIDDLKDISQAGEDRGELRYSQIKVKSLGQNHAMARGKVQLKFKDGSSFDSWFSTVYVKTPFGWKALLTHN